MDTAHVTINGEEYPYLMGRGAIRLYCRKKGVADVGMQDLGKVLREQTTEDNDLLNYLCIKAGCSLEGKTFDMTYDEFTDLLDEQPHLVDEMDRIAMEQSPQPEQISGATPEGNMTPVKSN